MKHPDTKPVNFIVTSFGDIDFLHDIMEALKYGYEQGYHKTLCPILWKRFIVNFVIGETLRDTRRFSDGNYKIHEDVEHLHNYIGNGLTVKFEHKKPVYDFGEDAYLDVNLGEVYTY